MKPAVAPSALFKYNCIIPRIRTTVRPSNDDSDPVLARIAVDADILVCWAVASPGPTSHPVLRLGTRTRGNPLDPRANDDTLR